MQTKLIKYYTTEELETQLNAFLNSVKPTSVTGIIPAQDVMTGIPFVIVLYKA